MIPIVIEPTNLCFNIDNKFQYSTELEETKAFVEFTKRLRILFDELEERKLKIAITKELFSLFILSIPTKIYSDSKGIKRNAFNLFSIRFSKLAKSVHKYGDISCDTDIVRNEIQLDYLLSTEIYLHWLDMCGLIINKKLLPDILKSPNISVFKKDHAYLTNNENENTIIKIHDCLESIYNSKSLKAMRLSSIIQNFVKCDSITCKGTGDHSSMWVKSIRKLEDVPPFEREILAKFIETGLVKSILFLGFEKNMNSVKSPIILINSMKSMTSSDILMCTLIGNGVKQHCQDIKIEIYKGYGKILIDFFQDEITIQGLDAIMEPPAAATIDLDQ